MPSPVPGGSPGDAYVIVRTAPDPRFTRRGANLWHALEIGVPDAALGVTRAVPTLDGDIELRIPAGTQPGTVLHVRDKGLPRFGITGRGSLYVSVAVQVPEHLNPAERRLYEQLREAERAESEPTPARGEPRGAGRSGHERERSR